MSEQIKTIDIKTDGGTQPRASLDTDTVAEYAAAMKAMKNDGGEFPPISLFYDGDVYWIADGFHRLAAHNEVHRGLVPISANVKQGTQRDAILQSVGENAAHGLRRSRADKKRAVMRLLEDGEWGKWSDREIARRCRVSHPTVATLRKTLTGKFTSGERVYERDGKTAVMQTGKIGKSVMAKMDTSDDAISFLFNSDGSCYPSSPNAPVMFKNWSKVIEPELYWQKLSVISEYHNDWIRHSDTPDRRNEVLSGIAMSTRAFWGNAAWMTNKLVACVAAIILHDPGIVVWKNFLSQEYVDAFLEETADDDIRDVEETAVKLFVPPLFNKKCPNDDSILERTTTVNSGVAMASARCPKCKYESRHQSFKSNPVWNLISESGMNSVSPIADINISEDHKARIEWLESIAPIIAGMMKDLDMTNENEREFLLKLSTIASAVNNAIGTW